jgi:hypothetical protein
MDQKNFTIGILSVTAVVMLVGLLVIGTRPQHASASGMVVTQGDYVLVVGKLSATEEMVYVIDSPMGRMITYSFDTARRQIVLVEPQNLTEMREQAAKAAPQQPPANPPRPGARGGRKP